MPWTCPNAYVNPDGRPVTVTVTGSASASVAVIPNGVMDSPCSNVLLPGAVIAGGAFAVTVTVNVAVTASLTPSSAVIVAVYACAAASSATIPCTWSLA